MAKNIIICSDGTGNSDIKGRGTNVFKLYEAIDVHGHRSNPSIPAQVAYYDDGVGTEKLKWLRALTGAFGIGLARNVRQLYRQLVEVYQPGDRIYLFGFSRGAFTARTLGGMIVNCGILDRAEFETPGELRKGVRRAYREYRGRNPTRLARWLGRGNRAMTYCRSKCVRDVEHAPEGRVRIRFIGVWDTVDAVGLPLSIADFWNNYIWRFKFKDQILSPQVDQGCHALAVDDERQSFKPLLWDLRDEPRPERMEQVWFAGAHSNVGGGYPRQGMSLVALDWMMRRAAAAGLHFSTEDLAYYREHRNVDDKLYDPRSGFGVFYRWKPRDIADLCGQLHVPVQIHASLFERVARGTEGYAPRNVPPNARVVANSAGPHLRAIEAIMGDAKTSVLADCTTALAIGRLSYDALVGTVLFTAWATLRQAYLQSGSWSKTVMGVVTDPTTLLTAALSWWPIPVGLVGGVLVAYLLGSRTDKRLERTAARFWHHRRPRLLGPLGLADSSQPSPPARPTTTASEHGN